MKLSNEKQIFNLMDTNGRRNDVINALQGYLSILMDLNGEWDSLPNSLSQYLFYKKAIELSPDVFSTHTPYDKLQEKINRNSEFKNAIENNDLTWIQNNQTSYRELLGEFDQGIEDRARHYTSNLVKLGFTTQKREITSVGQLLLDKIRLNKDELECLLPVDNINIIYLRQLLKLRIYDVQGQNFYSPFLFALYALIHKNRISENEFFELVQGLNPYFDFTKLESYIDNYKEGDIVENINIDIPDDIQDSIINQTIFRKYFRNQKSSVAIDVYMAFYNMLYKFNNERNTASLNELLQYYENNKPMLNKAFGCGKNIFILRNGERPAPKEFIRKNKKIFESPLNKYLYTQFELSKRLDQIREYSDTTKRIFRATGIISFNNGYVELAYKELCTHIFKEQSLRQKIYGQSIDYIEYETKYDSYFCSITSLTEILLYSSEEILSITQSVKEDFGVSNIKQISEIVAKKRKYEFDEFIRNKYPLEKVKELLALFSNRNNDSKLKEYVSTDATVSTIYEFVVGIAWYYFAGKRIDLLSSYNLTLSANFEPLVHAGGGQGDIVIYEDDKVVMLEATLMNSSSQKRGEWEPVLRHSVNLKIEEEINGSQRQVTTFFIADEFDSNTINIWKAVAAVPMQSSVDRENFTENVVIMPINSSELSVLTDKSDEYDKIIDDVHSLFEVEKNNFDLNWRDEFIRKIV